ncbi:MAG: porin [Alphaproteobacteria bacterium]|nr:porin [Alphaproteobacteria bacterium]
MTLKSLKLAGMVLLGATSLTGLVAPPVVAAPVNQSEIDALKAQIKLLENKMNAVQAVQETKIDEIKSKQDEVQISYKNGRPVFRTGDGMFEMELRGRVHFDTGTYFQDDDALPAIAPGRDLGAGSNFRRARLGVQGTFMRDWDYRFEVNFGGSGGENDGTINYAHLTYTGIKPLKIDIGALKPSMTLEDTTSSNEITFIERASAVNMATSLGAGDSRTAIGVRGNTDNFYASLYYTGGQIGDGGTDEQTAVVGRAAYLIAPNPDLNVHIGASGTHVFEVNQDGAQTLNLRDRPELRIDATRLAFTGSLATESAQAYGPEFGMNWKNLYLQGEYYRYDIERQGAVSDADFDAWYIMGSYILTGETKRYDIKSASFGAPRPAGPFGFGNSPGVWEVAARYSATDLNDNDSSTFCPATGGTSLNPASTSSCIRGGEQDIITLGLNWYPNRNVRFMLNYLIADVDRRAYSNTSLASGGPNVQIGQDYQALALRTQFNW